MEEPDVVMLESSTNKVGIESPKMVSQIVCVEYKK